MGCDDAAACVIGGGKVKWKVSRNTQVVCCLMIEPEDSYTRMYHTCMHAYIHTYVHTYTFTYMNDRFKIPLAAECRSRCSGQSEYGK
jgi:hypothetical protein